MRGALIAGIDYYSNFISLHGCVNDANSVKTVLERNEDGDLNFDCSLKTAPNASGLIRKSELKDSIQDLFERDLDVALFYFAGHGYLESSGGYIMASDSERGDEGISLSVILGYANNSPAKNKIIILDSCHSGIAGESSVQKVSALSEGVTILTASTKEQYSSEINGRGLYTTLLVDALDGSAADLKGEITPSSVYTHIDQALGAFEQRPVFKTNVKEFVSLRKTISPISKKELRKIIEFFPTSGYEYNLDPTFEPEMKGRDGGLPDPIESNTKIFAVLQKYNRLNLLKPIGASHMWNAAMESKACKLTALGEHYRRLVVKNRI
ncbi:MAG: caspase family protein [Staphylococcus equorum]|nr:caspase family protein [Staphylococcus equorum]